MLYNLHLISGKLVRKASQLTFVTTFTPLLPTFLKKSQTHHHHHHHHSNNNNKQTTTTATTTAAAAAATAAATTTITTHRYFLGEGLTNGWMIDRFIQSSLKSILLSEMWDSSSSENGYLCASRWGRTLTQSQRQQPSRRSSHQLVRLTSAKCTSFKV